MYTDALLCADFARLPWKHQAIEFELHVEDEARALIWQMRTGKTKMIIDTACHLYLRGLIDAVIIIAPNGVHRNWCVRELPFHAWPSVPYTAIHWNSALAGTLRTDKTRVQKALEAEWWESAKAAFKFPGLRFFAFNSESVTRADVRKLIANIAKRMRFMLAVDESADFRTPGSKRSLMIRALAKRAAYRRILDGTMLTNSLLHAFSQFELLQPGALGFTRYDEFKARYSIWVEHGSARRPVFKEYQNESELRGRIAQWSSVVLREDCEDLPDVVPQEIEIPLTPEQIAAYEAIVCKKAVVADGKKVELSEQIMTLVKLQQIVSGFIIDEQGKIHNFPSLRLDILSDEVALSPGKVIVWCQFQEDIDRAAARLRADGWKIVEYHGRVSEHDKAKALTRFQNDPEVKGMVAQCQSAGRGLELSAADTLIWYSHTWNAILYQQATERATKMGGRNITAKHFMAPGIDFYMREKVTANIDIADDVAGRGLKQVLQEIRLCK